MKVLQTAFNLGQKAEIFLELTMGWNRKGKKNQNFGEIPKEKEAQTILDHEMVFGLHMSLSCTFFLNKKNLKNLKT